jgi:hypothetical protein
VDAETRFTAIMRRGGDAFVEESRDLLRALGFAGAWVAGDYYQLLRVSRRGVEGGGENVLALSVLKAIVEVRFWWGE